MASSTASSPTRPLLLVRAPSPLLSQGQLTHLEASTSPPTHQVSLAQWKGYIDVWRRNGWDVIETTTADDCPDGVFLEDSIIVFPHLDGRQGGIVILPRSGSVERRKEYVTAKSIVEEHLIPRGFELYDFEVEDKSGKATSDGGDILKINLPGQEPTVYVGRSTRTNEEGLQLYKSILEPRGWKVVAVPVEHHLHLKSAITALPTGQIIGNFKPRSDSTSQQPSPGVSVPGQTILPIGEEQGIAVVDMSLSSADKDTSKRKVIISAKAEKTIEQLKQDGWDVATADIEDFEKMEGCVTCLSVRVRNPAPLKP